MPRPMVPCASHSPPQPCLQCSTNRVVTVRTRSHTNKQHLITVNRNTVNSPAPVTYTQVTSVFRKKMRPNMFFLEISSIQLRRFWWKLVCHFLNKFSAKSCKQFLRHPNNVSTLCCETHCMRATIELSEKLTPKLSHLNCCRQIWIQLIAMRGKYWNKRCKKQPPLISLIWNYRRHHQRMTAAMVTWSSLADSVLSHCFNLFRSVMRIMYTFSFNSTYNNCWTAIGIQEARWGL